MRVFVFLLMMAVTFGAATSGYRAITGRDLMDLTQLGTGTASAGPSAVTPTARPTQASAPTAVPIPTATIVAPTPTPATNAPKRMVIANTDGMGVYLRASPKLDDRVKPWVEGTQVDAFGSPIEGDGTKWLKVRTPDGADGFIPVQFLAPSP